MPAPDSADRSVRLALAGSSSTGERAAGAAAWPPGSGAAAWGCLPCPLAAPPVLCRGAATFLVAGRRGGRADRSWSSRVLGKADLVLDVAGRGRDASSSSSLLLGAAAGGGCRAVGGAATCWLELSRASRRLLTGRAMVGGAAATAVPGLLASRASRRLPGGAASGRLVLTVAGAVPGRFPARRCDSAER